MFFIGKPPELYVLNCGCVIDKERRLITAICLAHQFALKLEQPPATNAVDPIEGRDHGLTQRV